MALLNAEKKSKVHRKLLIVLIKNHRITWSEVKDYVRNLAKEIGENEKELVTVLKDLYQEVISDTFNPKNFKKKSKKNKKR